MTIYLDQTLPSGSCGQPGNRPDVLAFPYLALLRTGFTRPAGHPDCRWALTSPFRPYLFSQAVCFCCTFRRVAPPGCYPASCLEELGLSSRFKGGRPPGLLGKL